MSGIETSSNSWRIMRIAIYTNFDADESLVTKPESLEQNNPEHLAEARSGVRLLLYDEIGKGSFSSCSMKHYLCFSCALILA